MVRWSLSEGDEREGGVEEGRALYATFHIIPDSSDNLPLHCRAR